MKQNVYPGIHPQVRSLTCFNAIEEQIIDVIGKEWYITKGDEFQIGYHKSSSSIYRFILIKPTEKYQEMFNLDRELPLIFSDYETFEPRTLDAIDYVVKNFQKYRVEKVCSVLLSSDNKIEDKIYSLMKSDKESQIIIPISYFELINSRSDYFLINKFKKHFYTRDLFAFEGPLKKDLYFFGRNDLIHKIVNRHDSNENSGLFGLRKSGKTSVIYGIERTLDTKDEKSIVIDCQDTSFSKRKWNKALWYIILQIVKKYDININTNDEDKYTEENASIMFEGDMIKLYNRFNHNNILLIFDEIENITFNVSPIEHWEKDLDFVYFWQALRSLYQKHTNLFSYLIVSTNPMCVEKATVNGKTNPIFMSIPFEYIQPFTVSQTKEMIFKLGKFMGLNFDETIFAKLTEDFGGHPFLMRHVASVCSKIADQERPIRINRLIYKRAKDKFEKEYVEYVQMIWEVLAEYYKDEYDMLEFLAIGEVEDFKKFAMDTPQITNHLIGYGIIEQIGNEYDFKIDTVRKVLIQKNKYQNKILSPINMWREISERRNELEPKIRLIVRNQLQAVFGKTEAKEIVFKIFGKDRKRKYYSLPYKKIFDPNDCEIYFEDLAKIISKKWQNFNNIFGKNRDQFINDMKVINEYRADAHAKLVTQDEMSHFRVCISRIEKKVSEFME